MFFYLKMFIGNLLYKIGYLSGLTIDYLPQRRVCFGITMRKWRKREKLTERYREIIGGQAKGVSRC